MTIVCSGCGARSSAVRDEIRDDATGEVLPTYRPEHPLWVFAGNLFYCGPCSAARGKHKRVRSRWDGKQASKGRK